MKVIRKIYSMINSSVQSHVVKNREEANKWLIQKERNYQDNVNLEVVGNRSLDAVKIDNQWVIVETDIQD